MAQVNWTSEAQIWLRDIYDFIAAHIRDREVRVLVHGHYRIAYLIRAGSGDVDILGVFHGALPIERYLL